MGRTAESTVQGFLYQFNKTLNEILLASDGQRITVEGLVEDIDIEAQGGALSCVQCKYHESVEKFTPSIIFKPILQMAFHASENPGMNIAYKIFMHIPAEVQTLKQVELAHLDAALGSDNQKLAKIAANILKDFDKQEFLRKLTLEFGPSLLDLISNTKENIHRLEIDNSDVEGILYPNAINIVAQMAANKVIAERKITLMELREKLRVINDTALTSWTLSLMGREKLLKAKRAQLRASLNQNSRKRYFYISKSRIDKFSDEVVVFIGDFIKKYHYKPSHTETPIFALDVDSDELLEIEERLFRKGVRAWKGVVGRSLDENLFYKEPLRGGSRGSPEIEFHARIVSIKDQPGILNFRKCDDLYVVADDVPPDIDSADINVVMVGTDSFSQLSFVLGMRDGYE